VSEIIRFGSVEHLRWLRDHQPAGRCPCCERQVGNRCDSCEHPPDAERVAVALEARSAMRAHRDGKPIAFQNPTAPKTEERP
jgi:methionyl-tRNA synthetase